MTSIEQINDAITKQNPFAKPPFTGSKEVWQPSFDVKSINRHASNAVFKAIKDIQSDRYRTATILITAQDGTGKTHIISRIRHHLKSQGNALFIYANNYGDINNINSGFQRILANSFKKNGSKGIWQWQELAIDIGNKAFKVHDPNTSNLSAKAWIAQFKNKNQEQVKQYINTLIQLFCKNHDINNPDIIKAILWTLVEEQKLYAFQWLAGQEIAEYKAKELQLPCQNQSFDAIKQILDLISQYKELVICFDEIDSPEIHDNGFTLAQVVASLVKKLYENCDRVVILTVMMPGVWSNQVKQLPAGIHTKLHTFGNPIDLEYINSNSIIELVSLWLQNYYQANNLTPPHPLYPFSEAQLKTIGREKLTTREVLKWCKNWIVSPPPEPLTEIESAYNNELENIDDSWDEEQRITRAILFSFKMLIGRTLEKVKIEKVTEKVTKDNKKDSHINFKIIGTENGQKVKIGVAVIQALNGRTLGAGLRKLNDYNRFDLSCGCLIRSKDKQYTSYINNRYIKPLIEEKGGKFVELKEEQVKSLLAIYEVSQKKDVDYQDVSEEKISKFIKEKAAEKQLGTSNLLLKAILNSSHRTLPDEDMLETEINGNNGQKITEKKETVNTDLTIDNLLAELKTQYSQK